MTDQSWLDRLNNVLCADKKVFTCPNCNVFNLHHKESSDNINQYHLTEIKYKFGSQIWPTITCYSCKYEWIPKVKLDGI